MTKNSKLYFIDGWKYAVFIWDVYLTAALPDACGDGETIRLRMVKPCPRCPIPNIDPGTAHSTPHVIDCLGTYRQDARVNGAVSFGMNAIILAGLGTTLRVGQPLELDYGFE